MTNQPPPPDPDKPAIIELRTNLGRKAAYVRAARPGKLMAWIIKVLDLASGYKDNDKTKL